VGRREGGGRGSDYIFRKKTLSGATPVGIRGSGLDRLNTQGVQKRKKPASTVVGSLSGGKETVQNMFLAFRFATRNLRRTILWKAALHRFCADFSWRNRGCGKHEAAYYGTRHGVPLRDRLRITPLPAHAAFTAMEAPIPPGPGWRWRDENKPRFYARCASP